MLHTISNRYNIYRISQLKMQLHCMLRIDNCELLNIMGVMIWVLLYLRVDCSSLIVLKSASANFFERHRKGRKGLLQETRKVSHARLPPFFFFWLATAGLNVRWHRGVFQPASTYLPVINYVPYYIPKRKATGTSNPQLTILGMAWQMAIGH